MKCMKCGDIQISYSIDLKKIFGDKKSSIIPDKIYLCWDCYDKVVRQLWT